MIADFRIVDCMEIRQGIEGLATLPSGLAVTVGNFDGLHRGHQALIGTLRELRAGGATGVAVVTFEPHPLTVIRPDLAPPRLVLAEQKRELIAALGVDYLVELAPTKEVLDLSAEAFWAILRDQLRPSHIVEGKTFNFGKDRQGTIEKLRAWCADSTVQFHQIASVEEVLLDLSIVTVNSSMIRWLVWHGRVRDAAILLGRNHTLRGTIVKGYQRGRTIGFPTANFDCGKQLVPADGVYAGRIAIDGSTYVAAVSIGTMPTFGENSRQVEAYVVGWEGDLYGRVLELELIDWVRDQRRYNGIDLLKEQLSRDVAECERIVARHGRIARETVKV